jgi:hypothetical protein
MKFIQCIYFSLLFTLSSSLSFAGTYTFTGNGDYYDAANWDGGRVPYAPFNTTDTVIINGNATSASWLGDNPSTFIVSQGASLNLAGQFGDVLTYGQVHVYGSLINTEVYSNFGTVTVYPTGTLDNRKVLFNKGSIILKTGSKFYTGGSFNNASFAGLLGNGNVIGDISNPGTLAPGQSPGTYTVSGTYTAQSTAIHEFEVAGTAAGMFDVLSAGIANLNGVLNVTLINGFVPTNSHELPIITGTINGTFSSVNLPAGYSLEYRSNSVVLKSNLTPLPVNFISLDATRVNDGVKLLWKIADEVNVSKYVVERSVDGRDYKKVGEIQASVSNTYSYIDREANAKCYYRIKSIDIDGKYKYSTIVTFINGKSNVQLMLFPNPAKDLVSLQHAVASKGSSITLISELGQIAKVITPMENSQQTSIDLSGLNKGLYIVQFKNGEDKVQYIKFKKQ